MTFEHLIVKLLNGLYRPPTPRPNEGDLVLGVTHTQSRRMTVILPESARPMHLAVMGLSGTGKTYFLESLIRQDIEHGTGFVVFDVHGDLAESLVAFLAEHCGNRPEALNRVALVEPFDAMHTIGFNPLQRTADTPAFFQAQELAHILHSRWQTHSFGPRTEELLRSALYTLSVHDLTLVELPRILINQAFRNRLVRALPEQSVTDYWKGRYESLSEPMKAAVREPLLTRVSSFIADPQIREIVGQGKGTFSFRDAMEKGLFVVINLSKGRLGENSAVLGSLLFTKLQLDIMARSRVAERERRLFAVYADELQNLAGQNFSTLIAEARKYAVSVTAGNQFWRQLPPEMRAAMLGVGSRVLFRLHYHDALELAGELDSGEKQWYTELLTRLPRGQAVFRTGSDYPVPFVVTRHKPSRVRPEETEHLRDASRRNFAAPRDSVRQDIDHRYNEEARESLTELLGRPH
jgi:hypothetical protein